MKKNKGKKRRPIRFTPIDRESNGKVSELYRIMDDLIAECRPDLVDAKIALGWKNGWKPDIDGNVKLSDCVLVSEEHRELHGYHFLIRLNREHWKELTKVQREARIFRELCACQVSLDNNGEPIENEAGAKIYRKKNPDICEHFDVIARYGPYMLELERFVSKAVERRKQPLFNSDDDEGSPIIPMGATG